MTKEEVYDLLTALEETEVIIQSQGEISLLQRLRQSNVRTALVASGSCFEQELISGIEQLSRNRCTRAFSSLIVSKALKRQYHTLFEWEGKRLGFFKGLFGAQVKERFDAMAKDDEWSSQMRAFLTVGHSRNIASHKFNDEILLTLPEVRHYFSEGLSFLDSLLFVIGQAE